MGFDAVCLFSGGVDSTVLLAMALENGEKVLALSFDYGQRHRVELEAAKNIAKHYGVDHLVLNVDPRTFGSSCLVKDSGPLKDTVVPGRNTLFLAYAFSQAERIGAHTIYFGPNQADYDTYPDCREGFVFAFQKLIQLSSEQEKGPIICTPLLQMDKKEIVATGRQLNAPIEMTWTCYDPQPGKKPCHVCLACKARAEGLSS